MMGSSEEKFESYTKALQVSDTPCKIKESFADYLPGFNNAVLQTRRKITIH